MTVSGKSSLKRCVAQQPITDPTRSWRLEWAQSVSWIILYCSSSACPCHSPLLCVPHCTHYSVQFLHGYLCIIMFPASLQMLFLLPGHQDEETRVSVPYGPPNIRAINLSNSYQKREMWNWPIHRLELQLGSRTWSLWDPRFVFSTTRGIKKSRT